MTTTHDATTTTAPPDWDALVAAFRERAAALSVRVERAEGSEVAAKTIATLALEFGATQPILANELVAAAPALVKALAKAGVAWSPAGEPAATRDAPLGVSLASLAVAETGSVLLAEPSLEDRAIGLVAATQLVVCPTPALVPSLTDATDALRTVATRPGGGYATLVTGPSRTADIERVLTVGVQGPGRLAVLFIDGMD